mmetsp:Transcript_3486/g.6642  ORF Transcript_3486/g.6642 Transcript_3486/m.6642 type:complete len:232 (-) Transcript_3486:43-738(-)
MSPVNMGAATLRPARLCAINLGLHLSTYFIHSIAAQSLQLGIFGASSGKPHTGSDSKPAGSASIWSGTCHKKRMPGSSLQRDGSKFVHDLNSGSNAQGLSAISHLHKMLPTPAGSAFSSRPYISGHICGLWLMPQNFVPRGEKACINSSSVATTEATGSDVPWTELAAKPIKASTLATAAPVASRLLESVTRGRASKPCPPSEPCPPRVSMAAGSSGSASPTRSVPASAMV